MRTFNRPPIGDFAVVFVMETMHVCGLGVLFFCFLPYIDSIRGMMLTSGAFVIPATLKILKDFNRDEMGIKRIVIYALDALSIAAQFIGLIVWPLASDMKNPWAFVVGLFLTSFGWWESFVDEKSVDPLSKYLWRVKTSMQEQKSRYYTYFWICLWKMALFFALFVGLSAAVSPISEVKYLFDTFSTSFKGNGYNIHGVSNSSIDYLIIPLLNKGSTYVPLKVLGVQVASGYLTYIFGKFACKVNIQLEAFALPLTLVTPGIVGIAIGFCHVRSDDKCAFNLMPNYLFFDCPNLSELMTSLHGWMWVIWVLSQFWISSHIWMPKSRRLASTEHMFGTPYFCGLMVQGSMTFNRRSDKGKLKYRLDMADKSSINGENDYEEIRRIERSSFRSQASTESGSNANTPKRTQLVTGKFKYLETSDYDEVTRIMGCATMWHENSDEMIEMIKSIFRIDEDYSARYVLTSISHLF